MLKYLTYSFFIACSISCAAGNSKSLKSSTEFKPAITSFSDGITFISLRFKKENASIQVSYVETIQSEGTLKESNPYQKTPESKYLIQLQNEKGKPLLDCYINDPLTEHKDVFSESGKIEKGEVKYEEKIISLRIQKLYETIAKSAIFEISASPQPKYLQTLNFRL